MLKDFLKNANFGISLIVFAMAIGIAAITLPIFGNKALIVKSGSMQPTIGVGDLIAVKNIQGLILPQPLPMRKYSEGDVIAFKDAKNPKIVTTHRIVSSQIKDGKVYYQTKGDANNTKDNNLVAEENILGRADYSVKGIGKIFAFAKTRAGLMTMIIFPALMVILIEAVSLARELKKKNYRAPSVNFSTAVVTKTAVPVFAAALMFTTTFAFFSDSGQSSDNTFTAAESFGTDHIVISEIQINGANANQDFVELYNPTNSAIDLNGWQIQKKTSTGTISSVVLIGSGETIPAHGFFLWANSQGNPSFSSSVGADVATTVNLSENNGIALENASDVIVDQVGWGTGSQYVEGTLINNGSDTNKSMERKALSTSTSVTMGSAGADEFKGNGFDSNNNATDFYLRATSQPQNSSSAAETP